jgi:PmbA protein
MITPFHILQLEVMNKPMSSGKRERFSNSADALSNIAQQMIEYAEKQGATAASAEVSEGFGQSVTVRQGEVETIEYNRDKGLAITVYLGKKRGNASTSDFSLQAVRDTVDAALSIARYTAIDECSGLPDEENLARDFPDFDLYHPWQISVDEAIDLARECERAALDADKRIDNSEGATVNVHEAQFVLANSLGFIAGYPTSRHSISCSVIASQDDAMERDYWYSVARSANDLESAVDVGRIAAMRTVRRLGARQMPTMQVPVLFDPSVASSLLGHFVGAVSGVSLYRRSSFLLDQLGSQVFSPCVNILDAPDIPRGLASGAFDDEGVRTERRNVVENGVLKGYFLGSYSARKLNLRTTGNAGGSHNLILQPSCGLDQKGLMKAMGRGLFVTELLGQGVNSTTGDYSRGAAGFWVEGGEIAHPVNEVTIAGNLKDMYRNIAATGKDVLVQGSRQCGSVLVEGMTVAGS